jgi:hypothetical protein
MGAKIGAPWEFLQPYTLGNHEVLGIEALRVVCAKFCKIPGAGLVMA